MYRLGDKYIMGWIKPVGGVVKHDVDENNNLLPTAPCLCDECKEEKEGLPLLI